MNNDYRSTKDQTERAGIEVPVYEIIMTIFIIAVLILLVIGFVAPGEISAIQQAALFAASGACGVIARIA